MKRIIIIFLFFMLFYEALFASQKLALIVGIGNYDTPSTGWRKVHGDADVSLLAPLFRKQGFEVSTLVNQEATKANIVKALTLLGKKCSKGDQVYFQFSGHGQRIKDFNGDERDGIDEVLVCYDAYRTPGYAPPPLFYNGESHLLDDEMAPLFQKIRDKIGGDGSLFIVFDACYSRGLEKGGEEEEEEWTDDYPQIVRGSEELFSPIDDSYLLGIPPPSAYPSGALTAVVSACKETERNFEIRVGGNYYGTLSYCISRLLREPVDFESWIRYFRSDAYRNLGIFPAYQHPSINIYQ